VAALQKRSATDHQLAQPVPPTQEVVKKTSGRGWTRMTKLSVHFRI
jgi:hypothetical protein